MNKKNKATRLQEADNGTKTNILHKSAQTRQSKTNRRNATNIVAAWRRWITDAYQKLRQQSPVKSKRDPGNANGVDSVSNRDGTTLPRGN